MVDIINLYENPWDIASSGTDTLPRGLNPNVYTTAAGYPYGITNPSLYRPLFSSRLATLSDAISCVITEEINGIYTLDMTYPVDGNGAGLIKAGRIIAAKNYPKGSRQLFKITQISKTLKNTITVRGEHLSYDLSDYTLQPITGGAQDQETGELKPIQATLDKAIEYIQGEDIYYEDVGTFNPGWIVGDIYNRTPPYTEQGDQPSVQTFPFRFGVATQYYDPAKAEIGQNPWTSTYDYRHAVKEIYSDKIGTVREYLGASNTGLLTVFGGEVIFDIDDGGYADVIFTPQMGQDRGFKVVYGKNLKSMNYKIQAGKQKSAWFPYYKYTMNSDLHINLFWEIDNDLSTERARQIIGSGVNPYEGQIKPPLVYEHMDDFQSYVNIFPVDVTSEVDQFLKLIGESWGHITPDSHDQPGEAEDKSIMRSWALSVGLSAYWDVNGTLGYAPTSSELTFDFASLYATDSNAVEADVRLGDTVTVIYDEDGTSVKKRVIKIEYDAATGRYKKITLGDPKNKRKTAAGSIAESSLNSTAAIDTAYANAASFKRDVLELVGTAFNSNLTVTTPLEKTYSIDSVSKNPSMALEIKGTTNDDGKCLTWRHNVSDDTWSAVWEEVSRDHYTGQAPIRINDQNVISLSYDSTSLAVTQGSPYKLYIKNPVPAYEERNDGQYLRVYYDPETTDISIGWYSMSLATSSVVGGIKIGYQPAANTKNYAVQLSDGKAYVNVPWTDTTYSAGTGISINNRNEINVLYPVPAYTDTEVGKVLKVFTADPDGEYLDWTTLTTSDISNIETWISGKSYATTTYVNEIASGLSAAYSVRVGQNPSFNSQSDYITITGPITTTAGASIPLSSLKVGDVVYVVDTDIPDRWVSSVTSSSATLYTLETVKPAIIDVQINSSSIVSNRTANIALSSSFGFNTTNNTLSLQKAGSSTLGGIKTGYAPAVGSKDYAVMVDSNGNAHVVVPWESVPNGTNSGDVLRWNSEDDTWEPLAPSWYLASNPNNYISRSGISATGAIAYNNSTGVISVASGYTIPTSSSYQPSVWNAKQDNLGTGTDGQVLFWHEGGPYWDSLPAKDTYTLTHPNNTNDIVLNKNGTAQNTITLGSNAWNSTAIPAPYTLTPANVGTTGSAGSSTKYAKGDHVHAITVTSGPANGQVTVGGTTVGVAGLQPIAFIEAPSLESGQRYLVYDYTDGYTWDALTWADIGSKPTTISGYGITDAKIQNGIITLGSNTITPVTSIQFGSGTAKTGNAITVAKADITSLGIPGSDTNTTYTLNVSGTGTNATKVGLVAGGSGSGTTWYTIPYATVAGEATKDSDSNTIADYYGHALTVSGNTIGLKNAQDDDITGSFITVPYAAVAGSANSVAWANVSGHAAGVKADLAINASSGSTSKYLSEKGTWVSLPTDVNTWRDIGVNGDPWKGTGTGTGPIDFTNDTGISITTGTGQNANKLYIGLANTYGDTKNPYGTKSPHYVLAGPSSGSTAAAPIFRALVADDIPNLSASKITSGTFADARIASAATWNAKYAKPSGGIPASDLAESYYLASNPSGFTSNTGTVTSVTLTSGTGITVSNSGTAITTSGSRTISLNVSGASTALNLKQLAHVEATTNDTGNYLKAIADGDAVSYEWTTPPDNNTTYAISGALSSHKFTTTLTATNPSGTSTTDLTLVQGSNVTLTDDATNRKITIAATDTTYSFQEGSTDGGFQYKVNSGSWQNVAIHNAATIAYVNEKAAGLSASYAINTSSSVNPAFNVQTTSITVTSFVTTGGTTVQASSLKVGDTVYVTNSDIPDRWVGAVTSSNATLYILETAKPAVVDVKFDSTSLLNTSTRVATLNHGKAISFNTTDKAISVNIDTNTMAYVDSDTKIGVDTTKIPLISSLGDLAWLDTITNAKITGGTSGYLLKSNGTSAASWVSPDTLNVSHATTAESIYDPDSQTTYTIASSVPANAVFTDTKVTQTATTTSAVYEVLFSATADNTTRTEGARKNNNLTFNPSTGNLSSVIYTVMVGTTAKASMQYNSTTDAIDFVFVA